MAQGQPPGRAPVPEEENGQGPIQPLELIQPQSNNESPALFALIVGINKYNDRQVRDLKGCVNDAHNITGFLKTRFGVCGDNIQLLLDEQATRKSIIGSLEALASNPRIRNGDPIVFFFAGQGAQVSPPKSWPAGNGANEMIQMLLPHDFCQSTSDNPSKQGIFDFTLDILLSKIMAKKGDNISVIIDSCRSGSMTRDNESDSVADVRSIQLQPDYQVLESTDEDLRSSFH